MKYTEINIVIQILIVFIVLIFYKKIQNQVNFNVKLLTTSVLYSPSKLFSFIKI